MYHFNFNEELTSFYVIKELLISVEKIT